MIHSSMLRFISVLALLAFFASSPKAAIPPDQQTILRFRNIQEGGFGIDAEARLANKLLQGQDLPTIANEFAVGHNTVRAQLRALFRKTATKKQHELVALLASIPKPPDWPEP